MRLWLDNTRPAPKGWTAVKTVADAQKHLESAGVERLSMDHDLDGDETGMHVLEWMKNTGHWPRYAPKVHSGNPDGAKRMKAFIAEHSGRPDAPRSTRRKLSTGGSNRYARALNQTHY